MNKDQLRKRWTPAQCKRITRDLETGKVPRDVPIVEHDGIERLDLRGFTFLSTVKFKFLERWDFSCAKFDHGGWLSVHNLVIKQCRFVRFDMEGNLGDHVSDCDFSYARLRCEFTGLFERCTFANAVLRNMRCSFDTRFTQCDFTEAKLGGSDLNGAVFERCTWTGTRFGRGSANGTQWIGTRPTAEQLSDTFIMTPEEAENERRIELEVEDEMRRLASDQGKRKRQIGRG